MLVSDLRTKSEKELNELINDLKAELFMLRFKNSTGQLDQPHKINVVKKDIAKVFTILYEHEKGIVMKTTNKAIKKPKEKVKPNAKLKTQTIKEKVKLKTKTIKEKVKSKTKVIKENAKPQIIKKKEGK